MLKVQSKKLNILMLASKEKLMWNKYLVRECDCPQTTTPDLETKLFKGRYYIIKRRSHTNTRYEGWK